MRHSFFVSGDTMLLIFHVGTPYFYHTVNSLFHNGAALALSEISHAACHTIDSKAFDMLLIRYIIPKLSYADV